MPKKELKSFEEILEFVKQLEIERQNIVKAIERFEQDTKKFSEERTELIEKVSKKGVATYINELEALHVFFLKAMHRKMFFIQENPERADSLL